MPCQVPGSCYDFRAFEVRDKFPPIPFSSNGFDILAMWQSQAEERTEFVYLLRWPDEPTMRDAWARFMDDEEWKGIKRVTSAQHGDLVGEIEDRVLLLTGYSPDMLEANQA